MGRRAVKRRLRKNGVQDRLKPAADAKKVAPDQTESCLPDSYRETRVVFLPVEPYLVHVYWEVTSVGLEKAKRRFGGDPARARAILRFYEVTHIIFDGTNAHGSFDVDIDLLANNWYVHLWSPGKSYFVELGFKGEDGQFYAIARSNIAEIPPAWPSRKASEDYMLVLGDYGFVKTVPTGVQPATAKKKNRLGNVKSAGRIGAAVILRRRLAELRRFRMGRKPPVKAEVPLMQGLHFQHEKGRLDLTEMSEKMFASGVSSRLLP